MRTMADALTGANIPAGRFDLIGYYVDGNTSGWPQSELDRLKASLQVGISAINTDAGTANDMERGNGNAQQVLAWIVKRRAAGIDPTVYCAPGYRGGYGQQDLIDACASAGVALPWWWIADATMTPHMYPGDRVVATQWAVDTQLKLGYDLSMVADYWPGVDPAPVEDDYMGLSFNVNIAGGGHSTQSGIYAGGTASGKTRIWYVYMNCDTADGPGPVDVEWYLNGPDGVGAITSGKVTCVADKSTPPLVIDPTLTGGKWCYLELYNKGSQPVNVYGQTDF